jgi:hypothetical protein
MLWPLAPREYNFLTWYQSYRLAPRCSRHLAPVSVAGSRLTAVFFLDRVFDPSSSILAPPAPARDSSISIRSTSPATAPWPASRPPPDRLHSRREPPRLPSASASSPSPISPRASSVLKPPSPQRLRPRSFAPAATPSPSPQRLRLEVSCCSGGFSADRFSADRSLLGIAARLIGSTAASIVQVTGRRLRALPCSARP